MNVAQRKILEIFLDVICYEADHFSDGFLLSEECDRFIATRPVLGRALILSVGAALTLHLANSVPWQADLVSQKFWGRFRRPRFGLAVPDRG